METWKTPTFLWGFFLAIFYYKTGEKVNFLTKMCPPVGVSPIYIYIYIYEILWPKANLRGQMPTLHSQRFSVVCCGNQWHPAKICDIHISLELEYAPSEPIWSPLAPPGLLFPLFLSFFVSLSLLHRSLYKGYLWKTSGDVEGNLKALPQALAFLNTCSTTLGGARKVTNAPPSLSRGTIFTTWRWQWAALRQLRSMDQCQWKHKHFGWGSACGLKR